MENDIKRNFLLKEKDISIYGTPSINGIRLKNENDDFRPSFYRDIDRIINYSSYTRYMNKTQVFSFLENDNVQTRIVHISLVSKIARTIGRALNLNEDLIEAISLGHDIGHPPIGHVGEKILNKISLDKLNKPFMHNIEGVRNYMVLENDGIGSNLTIQVLDGIMCHNGEKIYNIYRPKNKTKEEFLMEYNKACLNKNFDLTPMTLEGCIVKISDVISYVGRDIEDAIRLNFIKRDDIPSNITSILGNNNKDIVNNLVTDIINNSLNKPYIKLSDNIYNALNDLVKFNYDNIYNKANSNDTINYYKDIFNKVYDKFLNDLENNNRESVIYNVFLNNMVNEYILNNSNEQKVLDFISLMTDEYLLMEYRKNN